MRFSTGRLMVGTAALLVGILAITSQSTPLVAAGSDDTIKAVVEQDIKNIQDIAAAGKFAKSQVKGLRSNTLMIAYLCQTEMSKNAADAGKLATLRDQALAFGKLLDDKKNFPKLAKASKEMSWLPAADPKAKTEAVKIEQVGDYDIGELMQQFRKPDQGGLGVEDDIKKLAVAKKLSEADIKKIGIMAARTLAVAELTDTITTALPTTKKKEDWAKFNKGTKDAAKELAEAVKGGKAKAISEALTKTDTSCTACHNVFKK
jgi:hypothetical protein